MRSRKYEYVYAVRDRKSGGLISKQNGNPFFTSEYFAKVYLNNCKYPYWRDGVEDVELVKFKLVEEGVEDN